MLKMADYTPKYDRKNVATLVGAIFGHNRIVGLVDDSHTIDSVMDDVIGGITHELTKRGILLYYGLPDREPTPTYVELGKVFYKGQTTTRKHRETYDLDKGNSDVLEVAKQYGINPDNITGAQMTIATTVPISGGVITGAAASIHVKKGLRMLRHPSLSKKLKQIIVFAPENQP